MLRNNFFHHKNSNNPQYQSYIELYQQTAIAKDQRQRNSFSYLTRGYQFESYEERISQQISDHSTYYSLLNQIQELPNKTTYLYTFTNFDTFNQVEEARTLFHKELSKLNNIKICEYTEFDFFSIIEPSPNLTPHWHIKLVYTDTIGVQAKIRKIINKVKRKCTKKIFTNEKKQGLYIHQDDTKEKNKDKYLLKHILSSKIAPTQTERKNKEGQTYIKNYTPIEKHTQAYIGWLLSNGSSISKAIKHSKFISIQENKEVNQIGIKKYKQLVWFLKTRYNAVITLKNVRNFCRYGEVQEFLISLSKSFEDRSDTYIVELLKSQEHNEAKSIIIQKQKEIKEYIVQFAEDTKIINPKQNAFKSPLLIQEIQEYIESFKFQPLNLSNFIGILFSSIPLQSAYYTSFEVYTNKIEIVVCVYIYNQVEFQGVTFVCIGVCISTMARPPPRARPPPLLFGIFDYIWIQSIGIFFSSLNTAYKRTHIAPMLSVLSTSSRCILIFQARKSLFLMSNIFVPWFLILWLLLIHLE